MQQAIVNRIYLRAVMNGTRPKMPIPRTPTAELAREHLRKTIAANGCTFPMYIEHEVLDGKEHALVRSPFPQVCDWGLTEYTCWMKYGHHPVEHVRIRVANRLMVNPEDIYIIKGDETAGMPNYQVFVESDPTQIEAPLYERPGGPQKSTWEYQKEWSALLGIPVRVQCGFPYNWLPESTMKHGLHITCFKVQRWSDVIRRRIMWSLWFMLLVAVMIIVDIYDTYYG